MTDMPNLDISEKLMPCTFKFHNFNIKVGDVTISCEIIKMEDCLYLWIGDCANPNMNDLSFALMSRFERQPIATKIMGAVADPTSTNVASRLSMKLGKPVYVSFNATANNITLPAIEKGIQEEFKTHADLLSF
ncbi:hypothetical protein DMN91_003559 [Ooceraea biroi]|uniref:Proteasome assembly chaperone n=1 Tax=Ooceraea biroi TaxID=2015173 RepID=A0A026X178_OOCBI|nr:proteasome assembly chaperone 4 [Ooceraea biroi]XP_011343818.1 proteasome assembly chaperone 4 [Ooceraea biroi]XP_011343827.1 proteasome assembly chaperone 4 [Ooceraea biroi]EZA61761.1 Proteasome assembly chaperone [Ooceraea biroi]RLU23355.1 hypothetical protein DMN91_003559 [Ooceraea biroi]